jgi:CBS-domain-containing membrane protein
MSRDDAYLRATLQHLGAAYYKTLNGDGAASEVARAVEAVTAAEGSPGLAAQSGRSAASSDADTHRGGRRHRSWRISDVMTADVATADSDMTCKRVIMLMTDRHVNAVPVVDSGRKVLGMVSEADVLRKQERHPARSAGLLHRRAERAWEARTVGELMTSPAVTVQPDAPLDAAARLMNAHHIRRLPVVDGSGDLVGVVSRRDLMKVFLRPDAEIEAEIQDVLAAILLEDANTITVSVREGIVTLTGTLADEDTLRLVTRLAADVPGVVAVASQLAGQDQAEPGS